MGAQAGLQKKAARWPKERKGNRAVFWSLSLLEGHSRLSVAACDGTASQEVARGWAQPHEFEILSDTSSLQIEGLVRIPCLWESSDPKDSSRLGQVIKPE